MNYSTWQLYINVWTIPPRAFQKAVSKQKLTSFLFSDFFVASQKVLWRPSFKAFIKPFQALQRSAKIKI